MTSRVGKTSTGTQRRLAAQQNERAAMHRAHRRTRPHTSSRIGVLCVTLTFVLWRGAAVACSLDAECDDGLACNGLETCQAGVCTSGTAVDCSALADQCNDALCAEPSGSCVVLPKIDGFGCDDGDICTTRDICQNGSCVGTSGADSDGDGYCDAQEIQAQCNPNDRHEIPPQPNVYSGGRASSRGEVLLAFRAPSDRDVKLVSNASCATTGICNPVTGFCTSGKVDDPCSTAKDCDQPADTCRVVINYAAAPDLMLQEVRLRRLRQPPTDLLADFLPATPGCSRKVDVTLPVGFKRATLRLKASGTTSGRRRKDTDRIKYRE